MATAVSNTDDLIDSRRVLERIAELQETVTEDGDRLDEEERAELDALTKLAEEASDYSVDWEYGETLIRDSYFVEYAQELAEDIGAVGSDKQWPVCCIDWEWAARMLQHDYTSVEFDGVTYWVR